MKTLRCSSMDRLFACTPSVLDDTLPRSSSGGPAAQVGKAVHQLVADYIDSGEYKIEDALARHSLSKSQTEEVEKLTVFATQAWDSLRVHFPIPKTECIVNSGLLKTKHPFEIEGTVDVLSPVGLDGASFIDWKTGYIEDGYANQMLAYAYCMWCQLGRPDDGEITGACVFLRHYYYRIYKYTARTLRDWEHDLFHNVLPKQKFSPGKQCAFCDLHDVCPGRRELVKGTVDSLLTETDDNVMNRAVEMLSSLSPENRDDEVVRETVTTLLGRLKLVEKATAQLKDLLREGVKRAGFIELKDGNVLTMKEYETREVNPIQAMPVLRQHLSDEEIAQAMKISLPRVMSAVRSNKPKGKKSAAANQLEAKLMSAAAITTEVRHKLEVAHHSRMKLDDQAAE